MSPNQVIADTGVALGHARILAPPLPSTRSQVMTHRGRETRRAVSRSAQVSGSRSRSVRRRTTTSSAPSRSTLAPTTAAISHGPPAVSDRPPGGAEDAPEVVLGRRDPLGQGVAAGRREAPDGDHGRAGERVAFGLLREREAARELGRERRRDRCGRAATRLRPAEAEPVRRHDQHRRPEGADGFEVVAHGRDVGLRVLERLGLAARVVLVREEDDLDRVPASRGRVEHAAKLELDRDVGRRGVRREQRVRLEVVRGRVAVRQRARRAGERGQRDRERDDERAPRWKEGRRASAPPAVAIRGLDRPTSSWRAAPRRTPSRGAASGRGRRSGRSSVRVRCRSRSGRGAGDRPGSRT